jgi:CRP-like cAMP-binding protein
MSDFETISFAAGERIFSSGDTADQLFLIKEGVVQLLDAEGKVFAQILKGESFGEQAFLSGGIRGATAQALGDVVCLRIPGEKANALLAGVSSLMVPVFEALLLQQNMYNNLRKPDK